MQPPERTIAFYEENQHLIDVPVSSHGSTPIHAAAYNGDVELIEALMRLGCTTIDTPDKDGNTAMHTAWRGHDSALEALVRLGSTAIDTPNKNGWTPMHAAATEGRASTVETLVRLGSQAVDARDDHGWTPMPYTRFPKTEKALIALGTPPFAPKGRRSMLRFPTEEETLKIRYRVYFGESAVSRLLRAIKDF